MVALQSKSWTIVGQSSVPVSGAADTNENTLATVVIPAGAMGPNGRVRIKTLWSFTNSGNNKILRAKFGGTVYMQTIMTTNVTLIDVRELGNRNNAASQVGSPNGTTGGLGATSGAVSTSSIDTAAAVDVTLTAQKASAGETITLESYTVELMYGA